MCCPRSKICHSGQCLCKCSYHHPVACGVEKLGLLARSGAFPAVIFSSLTESLGGNATASVLCALRIASRMRQSSVDSYLPAMAILSNNMLSMIIPHQSRRLISREVNIVLLYLTIKRPIFTYRSDFLMCKSSQDSCHCRMFCGLSRPAPASSALLGPHGNCS